MSSVIFMAFGVALLIVSVWLRYFRCRYVWADCVLVASTVIFAGGVVLSLNPACAAELPGPAAMAPVTAAPFVRPWWLDLLNALLPELIKAAVLAVLGAYGWTLKRSATLKGLQADAETRAYLVDGGQRAIDLAYRTAGVVPGVSLTEVQLTRILGEAADYMLSRFPDGLRRFGISDVAPLRDFVAALQAQAEMRARTGLSSAAANAEQPGLAAGGVVRGYAANAPLIGEPGNARSAIADLERLAAAARGAPVPSDPVTTGQPPLAAQIAADLRAGTFRGGPPSER